MAAGSLWVDDAVGVMLDELQTLGTLDQTLVLFLMDHGMKGKGRLWEQGMRIATFARFPLAFAAGTVISEPVSNIDVRRPPAARLYARPHARTRRTRLTTIATVHICRSHSVILRSLCAQIAPTFYALAKHSGASLAPFDFDGQSLVTIHTDGTLAPAAAAPRVLFFEEGQSRAVLLAGAGDYKLIHREIEKGCAPADEGADVRVLCFDALAADFDRVLRPFCEPPDWREPRRTCGLAAARRNAARRRPEHFVPGAREAIEAYAAEFYAGDAALYARACGNATRDFWSPRAKLPW